MALSDKLSEIFSKLSRRGKLNESDIKEAMREIKLALLEADVNFIVVKKFIAELSAKAVGAQILESLTPTQHVIKLVRDELTTLLGGSASELKFASNPPTVILMAGLQGAGKTTFCAKLAGFLKKKGRRPLLVACDIHRPAAISQLKTVAASVQVDFFEQGQSDVTSIYKAAAKFADKNMNDVIIIDTAGRLHIDEVMMSELSSLHKISKPSETLLVIDAMAGQDALTAAKTFSEAVALTGIVLTKTDGDTRGGAALSVKEVTGVPIKFIGTGEKSGGIELFHPDRFAGRILGMGDMLSLIEKAETAFDEKQAEQLTKKLRENAYTLDDFLAQMDQLKNMGDLSEILGMLPGASKLGKLDFDPKQTARVEAIIKSMTKAERFDPGIMNAGRRKRVARGSGTSVTEVNRLLNQFENSKKMMKQFSGGGAKKRLKGLPFM